MKREIKFRGKVIEHGGMFRNEKDGEWVYSEESFVHTGQGVFIGMYNEEVKVDPKTVGQFTGIKDKNGREVYEDDIVLQQQYGGGKGKMVVRFEKGAFIVGYHQWNCVKTKPMLLNGRCEVIGNIHDNPELLETE